MSIASYFGKLEIKINIKTEIVEINTYENLFFFATATKNIKFIANDN